MLQTPSEASNKAEAAPRPATQEAFSSKKQILKATSILGSAQVVNILVGIVRVKVLAVLLGATGVGIAGMYQTTLEFIRSATGFGLGYSAVRDIAASAATNDERQIAKTVIVLRRWAWATGLLGTVFTLLLSRQLSQWTFGTPEYAWGIALLSVGLLITAVANAEGAVLQGLRRIGDLAKANVLGAIIGLFVAIAIYAIWGLQGIVPVILLTFLTSLFINGYYSRKLQLGKAPLSAAETFHKGKSMARLGFFMTITGLAASGTMFLVRAFLANEGGMASVGHFVAAWTVSSMYLSAVFGAMSADYFPRLSAVHHDKGAVSRLVNEQVEVAILITAPIIIGMVSFIDVVVRVFYSKDFGPTAYILDWQLVGDMFKVPVWALGFIMLAKGKGRIFIITELVWNLLYCGGVYFGWRYWGVEVTGIAFLFAYLCSFFMIWWVAGRLVGFTWSAKAIQYLLTFLLLLIFCFLSVRYLPAGLRYSLCALFTAIAAGFSFFHLRNIAGASGMLDRFRKGRRS